MVYDRENRRISEFEDESIDQSKVSYFKLKLYNENKEYTVDLKTRKCNVTTPRPSFFPNYGVPPDADFVNEAVIGAAGVPGESVTVANFDHRDSEGAYGVAVTEPNCFPIGYAFFSKGELEETRFYDMQEGISDPTVFAIPKECTP